jgi:hypothetical protein
MNVTNTNPFIQTTYNNIDTEINNNKYNNKTNNQGQAGYKFMDTLNNNNNRNSYGVNYNNTVAANYNNTIVQVTNTDLPITRPQNNNNNNMTTSQQVYIYI